MPYVVLFLIAFASASSTQEKPPLKLLHTTPLPGFTGDFDHFGVDLRGKRLFLAAEDHKTVEMFNLETGGLVKSITGFGQPHAILYLPESGNLRVTDGGEDFGRVELVSGKTYAIMKTIELHADVDGAVFNPVNKYYYVENGARSARTLYLSVIDTRTFQHLGDITLPGNHSEAMAVDRQGKKLYVNLSGTNEVGVVDLATQEVTAKWPVPDAKVENSMVLDEPNHRLFIATRNPPKFIVFDTDKGSVVTTLPCAALNDDMWFDHDLRRIYASGTETTTIIEQRDANHYEHIAEVPTGYRAKTSLFVPQLHRLYVAVSGKGKPGAQLAMQIYDVLP